MFINRESELELLERVFASEKAELFALYGRRRVGKTELLARFCQDKRNLFFVADLDAEPVLRARFSAIVNTELLGQAASSAVYPSWEDIFLLIAEHAKTERLILVLDEFTYMVAGHPPLASTLQRLWDSHLRHTKIMLILCGSYIGMMEEEVLGYQAPLYGRRTGQYYLEPLRFQDAKLFFPAFPPEDQVRAYAVLGGTPAYLNLFSECDTLEEFIIEKILARGSFLYDEVRLLLQQELREPRNYFAILEAIAAGRTRLNEIKQATGLQGATAYLHTLQNLKLVDRVVPATERQPHKSRRGIYLLSDPYVRFWFRFLHPNRTLLERGGAQVVFDARIRPQLDSFTAPIFEDICRHQLWRYALQNKLSFQPLRIGGWWRGNQEVDIVAIGEESILLGECKWSRNPVGVDVFRNLEKKTSAVVADSGPGSVQYALFSRSGFTDHLRRDVAEREDVFLFDLDEIID